MNRLVWVTGASGFFGRHLVKLLEQFMPTAKIIKIGTRIIPIDKWDDYYALDLTNQQMVRKLAKEHRPDLVFHMASLLPRSSDHNLWRTNVSGMYNLLTAIDSYIRQSVRVILVSSAAIYSRRRTTINENSSIMPLSAYGASKYCQELVADFYSDTKSIEVIIVRLFNLIGAGAASTLVSGYICEQIKNNCNTIRVSNLTSERDYIDVEDASFALWLIAVYGAPRECYNLCSGKSTAVMQLIGKFLAAARSKGLEIERAGVEPTSDRAVGNNSKVRRLGWCPKISLRMSVENMLMT